MDWKDHCVLGSSSVKSDVELRYVLFKVEPLKAKIDKKSVNWSVR